MGMYRSKRISHITITINNNDSHLSCKKQMQAATISWNIWNVFRLYNSTRHVYKTMKNNVEIALLDIP